MPPKRAPAPAHARIGARAAAAASAAAPALYSFAGLLAALMAAVRMLLGWVVMEAKDKVRGRVARVDARPFFLQGAPPVQGARRARGFNSLGTPSAGRLCPLSLMQSAQKPRKVVLQPVERGTEREHGHAGAGQRRRRECFMRAARRAPGALLSLRSHPLSRSRLLSHTDTDTPRAPISLSLPASPDPHTQEEGTRLPAADLEEAGRRRGRRRVAAQEEGGATAGRVPACARAQGRAHPAHRQRRLTQPDDADHAGGWSVRWSGADDDDEREGERVWKGWGGGWMMGAWGGGAGRQQATRARRQAARRVAAAPRPARCPSLPPSPCPSSLALPLSPALPSSYPTLFFFFIVRTGL